MISRRTLLAAPLAAALPFDMARAQDYPQRTIRIVVPIGPGSGTDSVARHIAAALSKAWNTPVVVENKLGAGGNIASEYVARAAPDGYTLLFTYASHYSNAQLEKTSFDPVKDYEPVARLALSPLLVTTASNSPFQNVRDVVAAAKAKPGTLTYGSSGNGTTSHMTGVLLASMAGITLNHVPYKAPSQVAIDAASGQLDLAMNGPSTVMPLIKAGRLRPIAVTTPTRLAQMPDVPTMAEAGLTGFDISSPIWMLAPHGTPPAIVNRLSEALAQFAARPEFKELCNGQGLEVDFQNAATYRASIPAEVDKWRRLVAMTATKTN